MLRDVVGVFICHQRTVDLRTSRLSKQDLANAGRRFFGNMTITIKLTRGLEVIVDDEDRDLSEYSWYATGNRGIGQRTVNMKKQQLHRVILERIIGRPIDKHEVCDHINGNPKDNRRCNLRICSHTDNMKNRGKARCNTTGYKGVFLDKNMSVTGRPYMARIRNNGKVISLGFFKSRIVAAFAYDKACKELHGEFARPNFNDDFTVNE